MIVNEAESSIANESKTYSQTLVSNGMIDLQNNLIEFISLLKD